MYIASRIMRTTSQQGLLMDIVVGVIGAFLAGSFISALRVLGRSMSRTIPTMLVTLIGAVFSCGSKQVASRR